MGSKHAKSKIARVGDIVTFDYGGILVTGVVVEDRGHIGVGGRRLARVKAESDDGAEPMFIELPDVALTVVKRVA